MSDYKDNDVLCYLHLMFNSDIESLFRKVWATDPVLAEHFIEKYNDYYKAYGSTGAPAIFFCSLSIANQRKITVYARLHYCN